MPLTLTDLVRDADAACHLRAYFAEDSPRRYTGRRFQALDGGGDRDATRDRITADDIVAVQMLGVRVPAEAAIALLDGEPGRQLTVLLSKVATGVELGTPAAGPLMDTDGLAEKAWNLLRERHGVGRVIAGKILARKRPGLVPVYDRVLACQFGRPQRFWVPLHNRLAADDGSLRRDLAALRTRAEIPATVSLLRVLDVTLWMRHHEQHTRQDCPEFDTVTLD